MVLLILSFKFWKSSNVMYAIKLCTNQKNAKHVILQSFASHVLKTYCFLPVIPSVPPVMRMMDSETYIKGYWNISMITKFSVLKKIATWRKSSRAMIILFDFIHNIAFEKTQFVPMNAVKNWTLKPENLISTNALKGWCVVNYVKV